MDNNDKNGYLEHEIDRKKHTDAVLNSISNKRIIVAGPGTGKSFLFQEVCKKNIKQGKNKNITLSFINELVDDLSKDLHSLSEVKTLHSFALGLIPGEPKIFLDLSDIIGNDYEIINNEKIDYNNIFCNLIDDSLKLEFYSKRRRYYNFFSPNCSIYTLTKIFEEQDLSIPAYSQILVDEFQDFNKLESKLLDFLSKKSPILIAGDDDQSLYSFKYANPTDIRTKHASGEYEQFQLPFCSRCTEVTINAFDSIVDQSRKFGFLKDRMPKEYRYFPTIEKDKASSENQKILIKKEVYQNVVAYNIDQEIKKIFDPRSKTLPSVLIICSLKQQIGELEKNLRKKGYRNIDASQKFEKNQIIDGFNLLLKNSKCNLGWRITSEQIYSQQGRGNEFKEIIKKSYATNEPLFNIVDAEEKKFIKRVLALLRKIKANTAISNDEYKEVFDCLRFDQNQITLNKLLDELEQNQKQKNIYKDTPIKITTILGSKGLTRDYSFLVNFDNKYLLDKDENRKMVITDGSICRFLVALTRARLRTYIYTSESKFPTFVNWIGNEFYEEI